MKKTFALYRGDQFIDLGTIEYLANLLGVKERTIKFYGSQLKFTFSRINKPINQITSDDIK